MQVEYFKKAIEDMAAGSLRCVALAYRPLKGESVPTDEEELSTWELPEGDLVLLAIVGLKVCNLLMLVPLDKFFMYGVKLHIQINF